MGRKGGTDLSQESKHRPREGGGIVASEERKKQPVTGSSALDLVWWEKGGKRYKKVVSQIEGGERGTSCFF